MPTVEELQAKIAALEAKLGSASSAADDEAGAPVPAYRFSQHREQLRSLRADVAEVKEQLGKTAAELKGSYETKLASELKKAREQYEQDVQSERGRASVDLELSDLGVKDPTIRKLIREHYTGMDEDGRPESPAKWLESRREAAKGETKPDPIPWLDAYEAHVAVQAKPEPQRRPPPNTDAGAGPQGGTDYSVDDLSSMSPDAIAKLAGIPIASEA